MQNFASKASGAALGYIVGNLPGAYLGYKMAPFRRGRVRSGRTNPYPTPPRSRKSFKTPSSTGSGTSKLGHENVVTRQHDYSKQYRYKKMPRWKKKSWRKFSKKVAAVQLKQAGLRTVVFNSKMQVGNDPGNQNVMVAGLYGVNGTFDDTANAGWSDLYRIFKNDPDIVKVANEPTSGKLQFGSAVIDLTLRNLDPNIELEVDVYYGWFRKDDNNDVIRAFRNPFYRYQTSAIDPIAPALTPTSLYWRGCTLFDRPAGIANCGYHITKKMKLLLAPGQTSFLQHRDAKNYMVDWQTVGDCGYGRKGLTFGMWFVMKPSVTQSNDATAQLAIGVTRKYSYAVVEDNVDRIAYNPPQ